MSDGISEPCYPVTLGVDDCFPSLGDNVSLVEVANELGRACSFLHCRVQSLDTPFLNKTCTV